MLSASFYRELTEDEAFVWFDTLAGVSYVHGDRAVRELRTTAKFMPSHAEFLEVVKVYRRREAERAATALPPATDREKNLERVRALKKLLAEARIGKVRERDDDNAAAS